MTKLPLFNDADLLDSGVGSHSSRRSQTAAAERAGLVRRSALWSAYGDALGWISELTDETGLKRRTANAPLERPVEWKRRIGGRAGVTVALPRGCYSDDSQLRLATGRAIGPHGFDVESFAKVELPVWLSYALGAGRGTSAAATNLARRRVQWFANTFKGWTDSGGNGAAMRIQPHVWAAADPSAPITFLPDVIQNSICTHSHPKGLLGAILHALALAHTMAEGQYPSPDEMIAAADVASGVPDLIRADVEVGNYWRSTLERETGPFDVGWAQAIEECREAIQVAADASSQDGTGSYIAVVDRLRMRDQARRGDGTLTAIAAMGLIWCETEPERAMSVAANAIGTDTDTIATMAGAILGVVAEEDPPVEVLDGELFRSEASRLAEIACGGKPPGHRYPDLLHWSAPKGRADTLVDLDGTGLYVRGFGPVEAQGEPMPASQGAFSWQWIKLGIGQTLLIKRRSRLPKVVEEDRGLTRIHSPHPPLHSAVGPKGVSDNASIAGNARLSSPTSSKSRSGSAKPGADLEIMIDHLERHGYEDKIVGQALRRVVNKCTTDQIAAFLSVLIDRLREPSSQDPRVEVTSILLRRKTKHFNADVLEADLRLWKGTPAIGFEIAKAKQHSDALYQEFYKGPAADIHRAISGLFEVRSDPRAAPRNEQVRKAWAILPEAIEAANAASQHVMVAYAPSDPKATKFFFHSEQVMYSLIEAERLLDE